VRLGRLVLDETRREGIYAIALEWAPDSIEAATPDTGAPPAGPSIFTAVQEQLGLKLLSTKRPVEILAVDHAEKSPTAN
jgi:uncharacterized protein (TIGR03435 family)